MDKQTAINMYANALDRYCVEGTQRYRDWLNNSTSQSAYYKRYFIQNETEFTTDNCVVSIEEWYSMLTEDERKEYSELCRRMDGVYCWLKYDYSTQVDRELIEKSCNIERRNWYDLRY